MHDDIPEIEWEDKQRSVEYWTDLCGLLPLRFEQDFKVGQELCTWWHGRCYQVTYVGQRMNWYDWNILVKWGDEDIYVRSEHTWALQDGTDMMAIKRWNSEKENAGADQGARVRS